MKKRLAAVLVIFLASPVGPVYGQSEPALDSLDELALSRALLDGQQDRFGLMDSRLVEPLEQLADQLMLLGRFDEAHVLLDRAMQIARVEDGLYTEIQRPLLRKKIENFANRGNWDSAKEGMEHLLWLYTNKSLRIDQLLIEDLLELSRLHLRAFSEDNSFWQGYHFEQSSRIRWLAIGVARSVWGKTDERLVPLIYEQLRQFHLQSVALWRGGATSYSLRRIAPGLDIMRNRSDVNESFYLSGLGLLDNLFLIYAESESPDPEAIAMTLYSKPQVAIEAYRQAYQELLAAGVDATLANEFFNQPMVIPETEFYASLEVAVAAQRNRMVTVGDGNSDAYLSFSEWSAALPNVRSPIPGNRTDSAAANSNFALFSFQLAGVNKASSWYSHRFSSTVSMIQQEELLGHYLETPPGEGQLLEKLKSLTFRPRLVDGEPRQATGRLKYYLAKGTLNSSLGGRP